MGFSSYTLNAGGTLPLDNTVSPVNNRLGGSFQLASPRVSSSVLHPALSDFQGGNLTIKGNGGTAVKENLGTVNVGSGGVLTLAANGTQGVNVNAYGVFNAGTPAPVFAGELYDLDASNQRRASRLTPAMLLRPMTPREMAITSATPASTVTVVNGGAAFNNRNVLNFNFATTSTLTMAQSHQPADRVHRREGHRQPYRR